MTCEERLERIFRGEMVDVIPFAMKGWRVQQCAAERALRNDGMGVMDNASVYRSRHGDVTEETHSYVENGLALQRRTLHTPRGDLTSVSRRVAENRSEMTTWTIEPLFKGPEDYAKLRSLVEDQKIEPCYDRFEQARAGMEGEAFFKTTAPAVPIHIILYQFLGVEQFAVEWSEHRDEIERLIGVMEAKHREIYRVVADSPALVVQVGGNYAPEMLGKPRFEKYVVPHWEDTGDILHAGGKLMGCHLDADNALWAKEVGDSKLDWIEAFTPAPDTDMSMKEAREAWRDKTFFINFPSSLHLSSHETIVRTTRQLIEDVAPGDRFIIGITENVPEDRWRESFRAILDTVNEFGRLPVT